MDQVTEWLQLVIYGVVMGSILALAGFGLSLTYRILNFAHFAHGDIMTLGAYLALLFYQLHLPLWGAGLLAMAATGLIAVAIDRVVYRPLRRTGPTTLLIASVGVALIVRHLIQLLWGPDNLVYEQGIQMPYRFAGLRIKPNQVLIVVAAGLLAVLVHLFLTRTRPGKAMRAVADNPDLARVTGIRTELVIAWTWVLGAGLAAASGTLLALDTYLRPTMGWNILLPVFAAVILGGIGSPYGAIAGGLVIGIAQELSTAFLPSEYKPLTAFVLMIAMLLARPQGLFGRAMATR